jgi:TPR repeat protein
MGRVVWSWIGVAVVAATASAAPADDHQRGLQAWQRGDVVAAMRALRPAADAGHVPSQTLLAFILDQAGFADEATRLYKAAAEQGDAEGHAGLAAAYQGGRGIAKDEKQAGLHFSKAAELGHAPSMAVLARAYRNGELGLAADPALAAQWQARAQASSAPRPAAAAASK